MAREIPEAWMVLLQRKGLSSARGLAMRAGVSHVTANRVIFGDPFYATEETLQKIADALTVPYDTVYQLAGRRVKGAEPWTPPASAARLTLAQREVLDQLINTMVNGAQTIHHPEDAELAADTSHGPAQSQRGEDESL
jgi:transcriptional regulator with XRE-family HTH domain